MKETALVVMAAGIGSRYGKGIKQLEHVGPSGEIIMDYAIYDAMEAGFNKVVFIIRKDLEEDFKEIIGNRIAEKIKVEYAFQEKDALPEGFACPPERKKPWGTGQAVLAAKPFLNMPFVVINADDYYGKEAFRLVHDYLVEDHPGEPMQFCMAGFILGNTLSENGGVTRGVCKVNAEGILEEVVETSDIKRNESGKVECIRDGKTVELDENTHVSMNMWGFTPKLTEELEKGFTRFLKDIKPEELLKKEYLLPGVVSDLITAGKAQVQVLETHDKWFGVTYAQDTPYVVKAFRALTDQGLYPESLY